jgi:hypothetical protein
MPHRRSPPLPSLIMCCLRLADTLVENLGILVSSILRSLCMTALERNSMTLVLQTLRSNEALDLRSLGVWFLALALRLDFTSDNELANLQNGTSDSTQEDRRSDDEKTHIIFLAETKEPANLGGSLGTQSLWVNSIGQAR